MSMTYSLNDKGVEVDDLGRERPVFVSDLDLKSRMQAQHTGEFPRVLYKGGLTKRVANAAEKAKAIEQGWALTVSQGDGGVILTDEPTLNGAVIDFDEAEPEKPKRGRPRRDAA